MDSQNDSVNVLVNRFNETGLNLICELFKQHLLKCIECGECLNCPCEKCDTICDEIGDKKVTD